jgi:hypothetical protein
LHDSAAAFLLDDFNLLFHHRVANFTLECFSNGALNTTSDFTSAFIPYETLGRVGLFAFERFCDGLHDGVAFFTISGFQDLSGNLVILFAILHSLNSSLAGFLNVIVFSLVNCTTDGVLLWLLHVVIDRALTGLSFHATGRVAT